MNQRKAAHPPRPIAVAALLAAVLLAAPAAMAAEAHTEVIHIVTPAWIDQTRPDGTGLFFDILRAVYEPEGVRVTFEILPWKRAAKMVAAKRADARLVVLGPPFEPVVPRYPLYVDHTAVVYKKENAPKVMNLESLRGLQAVWLRGYDYHLIEPLAGLGIRHYEVDRPTQSWGMLDQGKVDMLVDSQVDIRLYIKKNHVDPSKYRIQRLFSKNAYVQFADTVRASRLAGIWDREIIRLYKSGQLASLFSKWGIEFTPAPYEDAP